MIRLLKIELKKILPYRPFWVLMGLYTLLLFFVVNTLKTFNFSESLQGQTQQIDLSALNLYEFPFIWHVMAYTGSWWIVFPAIIIIILISNELSYNTLRQNIVSGLSRAEVLTGKLLVILLLSIYSTVLLFLLGLLMGFRYSTTTEINMIFGNMDFMLAAFIQAFRYMVFALLIGLFVKRSGFAIGLLLLYTFIAEPIISHFTNDTLDLLVPLGPTWDMVENPITKYFEMAGMVAQKSVAPVKIIASLIHLVVDVGLVYLVLRKRDL